MFSFMKALSSPLKAVAAAAVAASGKQIKMSPRNVVVITGCDSGLGHSLAVCCHDLQMTVIAGCHSVKSKGAQILQEMNNESKRMLTVEVDIVKEDTVAAVKRLIEDLLERNSNYELTAVVNNAGVMCFGEFEWQTWSQIEMQFNVNVLGTMRFTKKLLPLIRQQKSRIINVTSHCGLQPLPGVAAYSASKSALRFWNNSLRVEMQQYGVKVVNFIPGGFVMDSNIAARQQQYANEMLQNFNEEQKCFYGSYFERFHSYLELISGFKPPNKLKDHKLLEKFIDALTNSQPKSLYVHESLRYKIYRILFNWTPVSVSDWLSVKFCAMPTYQQVANETCKCN